MLAGVVHTPQFGLLLLRQFWLAALELALGSSDGHSFAGAHAEEVDFEFGEGGEDVRVSGADVRYHPTIVPLMR